jgi:DNA-binding response OmpR family regulator
VLKPRDSRSEWLQSANVLCLEPDRTDREALQEIFARVDWPMLPQTGWQVEARSTIDAAMSALRRRSAAILLCDSRPDGRTWRGMLELVSFLGDPPLMIVTSRMADECLWVEALNLGAHDVLAKPYAANEVMRVVSVAWTIWQERHAATTIAAPSDLGASPSVPPTRVIRGPAARSRS